MQIRSSKMFKRGAKTPPISGVFLPPASAPVQVDSHSFGVPVAAAASVAHAVALAFVVAQVVRGNYYAAACQEALAVVLFEEMQPHDLVAYPIFFQPCLLEAKHPQVCYYSVAHLAAAAVWKTATTAAC